MICLYDSKETNYNNNGLVVLSDSKTAYVEERLNDLYEYTLEYPLDSRGKWQYLLEGNIIKSSDGQLFRIYRKVKTLTGIKINARHIFYDLLDNFLEDVRPTDLSGAGALDWILTHTQYSHPFTSMSDIAHVDTAYYVKKNPVQAILGNDNSFVNLWGGEIVRDNFTIKTLQARGLDRGVLISYGKNIIGIEETIDLDSIVTRIYPTGKDGLTLTEKYVDSPYVNNFAHPKVKEISFSDIDNESDLRTAAQNYFIDTKCDIPQFNYKIDFMELSKTDEYKHYAILETVYMGDTVTIKHTRLNINLKAKVIRIKKNDLTGRIEEIELGSFKPNLATSLNNSIQNVKQEIVQVKSDYQKAIDNATALITGSNGGNVIIHQDANGHPYEILIMDTTDINTAQNVWRWNSGGFGYSSTGYNGPYGTAITMDGAIVADFITTGILNAGIVKSGILESLNNKSWINMEDGTFNFADKITFDNTNFSINADAVKMAVGQLGGNNLVKNSDFRFGTASWNFAPVSSITNEVTYNGKSVAKIYSTNNYYQGIMQGLGSVKANQEYTISFKAYTTNNVFTDGGFRVYMPTNDSNGQSISYNHFLTLDSNNLPNNVWKQFSVKVVTQSNAVTASLSMDFFYAGLIYIAEVKIEEGDNVTAWSPNANELKTSSFEVTDAHARFTGDNGSYTEFVPNQTGLKWHKNDGVTVYDYHYLNYVGTVIAPSSNSTVVIQLPDDFKGKNFKATVSMASTNNWNGGCVVHTFTCKITGCDYAAGTITLDAGMEVLYLDNPNTFIKIDCEISYTVIA